MFNFFFPVAAYLKKETESENHILLINSLACLAWSNFTTACYTVVQSSLLLDFDLQIVTHSVGCLGERGITAINVHNKSN